jgi:hypothetical protein
MKTLSIQLTEQQHDFFTRLAKADNRRLSDFSLLILAEGLQFYFSEQIISIPKQDDDYTEEEKAQRAKNDEITNQPDYPQIDYPEMEKRGWKNVPEYFSNRPPGEDFVANLSQSIRAQACK